MSASHLWFHQFFQHTAYLGASAEACELRKRPRVLNGQPGPRAKLWLHVAIPWPLFSSPLSVTTTTNYAAWGCICITSLFLSNISVSIAYSQSSSDRHSQWATIAMWRQFVQRAPQCNSSIQQTSKSRDRSCEDAIPYPSLCWSRLTHLQ